MGSCPNCDSPVEHAYCPNCGQKRTLPGIRLGEVLSEFAGGLFNVDAPVFRTLRGFLVGPGRVTREYIAGKRRMYTPPVRFFLFGIAFYFIVRWLFDWDPVLAMTRLVGESAPADTPSMRVNLWMSRNVNLLLPLWVLVLSWFDLVLFPKAGLRWVERTVHFLFAIGTYLILATLMIPLFKVWPGLQPVNYLIIFGVMIWSLVDLHGDGWWAILRSVLMVPLSFMLYVMLCTILVSMGLGIPLGEVFAR